MEEVIAQAPEVECRPRGARRCWRRRRCRGCWRCGRWAGEPSGSARELGCSRNTVREYLRRGGWQAMDVSRRASVIGPHREWLAERLRQHRGNCRRRAPGPAARARHRGEPAHRGARGRAAAPRAARRGGGHRPLRDRARPAAADRLRQHRRADRRRAGQGAPVRGHPGLLAPHLRGACSCTSASRRGCRAWKARSATSAALPRELLLDNAKALVDDHDAQTREVAFNDRFHAFCRYWGVMPRACAPYRARTKGKDERGVGYVKRNAIAGHRFASLEALHAHLARWMREVADVRVHGTTGEPPIDALRARRGRSA